MTPARVGRSLVPLWVVGALAAWTAVAGPAPGTTLATLKPGSEWQYRVTGTMTPPGGGAAAPLTGAIVIRIEAAPDFGPGVLALRFSQQLAMPPGMPTSIFGDAPPAAIFYIRQSPGEPDIYIVGDNQGPGGASRRARERGGLFIPGRWSADTRYDSRIEWDGGGWVRNFLAVDGVETIPSGLGPVVAWRAPNGSESSDGISISGADWWAPELGQPVQFDAVTRMPDGAQVAIRAVLQSMQVPGEAGK